METTPLIEYRCDCGRLLFKGVLVQAQVEVKCRRCGALVLFGSLNPAPACPCTLKESDILDQVPSR